MNRILSPILNSYLKDYILNLSSDKIKMELWNNEFSLENLLLSPKILDTLGSMPIRLKFGMIGKLKVVYAGSLLSGQVNGLKVEVENLFICLEQLDVSKWKDSIIEDMYQAQKKTRLRDQIQSGKAIYDQQEKEEEEQEESPEAEVASMSVLSMLRNSEITIKNLSIFFEDDDFNYQIGVLLPYIKLKSMQPQDRLVFADFATYTGKSKDQIKMEELEAKLQSRLVVEDVSIFVAQKGSPEEFKDIAFDNWVQKHTLVGKKEKATFENSRNWTQQDCDKIGAELKKHIHSMFEQSANRMKVPKENYYIFANVFRIVLETEYLFKHEVKSLIDNVLDFFCSLQIKSKEGSVEEVHPVIEITEHQLNALLHISTLLTAF